MEHIILASASPRRREIMTLLGLSFTVAPANNESGIDPDQPVEEAVLRVARDKAEKVARAYPEHTVIGADTVVTVDGLVLGKPESEARARQMLGLLSGRVHKVYTSVWVCRPGSSHGGSGFTECAEVEFYPLSGDEIREYIATGEPMDKAGSYGIQGIGMRFIKKINGDFYTVMGLPGARLWRFLNHMDKL